MRKKGGGNIGREKSGVKIYDKNAAGAVRSRQSKGICKNSQENGEI